MASAGLRRGKRARCGSNHEWDRDTASPWLTRHSPNPDRNCNPNPNPNPNPNSNANPNLLGLLGTRALIWDFEEFCNTVFLNHMFGEATLHHVQAVQICVLEKPYWGTVRSDVTVEVATDHLLEQLSVIGAKPPVEADAVLQTESW